METGAGKKHWEQVYSEKAPSSVSWYQENPEPSLRALGRIHASPHSSMIDVGGGASNLVDALLERGWKDITVLDIAAPALAAAKSRLGEAASEVDWQVADITAWHPEREYDVWHDRAVFHFLTEADQRAAYLRAVGDGLSAAGYLIIATFALDGPEKCSGLPVQRYDADSLARELGPSFKLLEGWREEHTTPWGSRQAFTWCIFRRA